jgi:DUF2971 family protein
MKQFDDNIFACEVGPRLHDSLKPSTPIYRIIDFFSAARLIRDHCLYVPLSTQFSDDNEGIERSLSIHATAAGPCAGAQSLFFQSKREFIEHQKLQKRFNYVSCWTQQRESVAMWALYSADHCSVQVETTIEKLSEAFKTFARKEYNPFNMSIDKGEKRNLVVSVDIMPVSYISLINLGRQIDRRRRAYDKLERLGKINLNAALTMESKRDRDRMFQYSFAPFSLKDESFSHEQEIRGILKMTPVDHQTLDEIQVALAKEDRSKAVNEVACNNAQTFNARCEAEEQARKRGLVLPRSIEFLTPHNFILSATIDPRCPPHKKAFIIDFLEAHNVHVTESRCFGHATDHISIVPRAKLLRGG